MQARDDQEKPCGQRLFQVLRSRPRESVQTKVYGRDEELASIQAAFDRVTDTKSPSSELVLVHGPSGCGKSSIVKSLIQWTKSERTEVNVFFGSGKYDQLVNNEPFAAIVAASSDLCKQLLRSGPAMTRRFNDGFKALVSNGQEAKMLSNAIPLLGELLEDVDSLEQNYSSLNQAFTRFKQLWRSFLLAMSACSDVMIMFLDDVQWADSNSLDLINSVLHELRCSNLLLICAYRDDASVEKTQIERLRWCFSLGKTRNSDGRQERRRSNKTDGKRMALPMTDCALENLAWDGTNEIIAGLLYGDRADEMSTLKSTHELTEVIFSHTDGNPFFILHYLDYLSAIGLLTTNDFGQKWEWDLFSIDHQEHVPENVAELLSQVLTTLPEKMVTILTTGAHVGFQFSSTLLEQDSLIKIGVPEQADDNAPRYLVASRKSARRGSSCNALVRDRIQMVLDAAVLEGLLERRSKHTYTFPHDQIQRALYMTLSDKPYEQEMLHLKIGRALLDMIEASQTQDQSSSSSNFAAEQEASDAALFIAVDNLNKGSSHVEGSDERYQLAHLNYEAAQAAMRKSAFEGAIGYARAAIALLDGDRWESRYEATLDLYSLAARLEHTGGNYSQCAAYLAEIQTHGKTIYDKLPSYFTQIDSMSAHGDLWPALKLGLMVLRQLGERIPSRPNVLNVIRELNRTTKVYKATKEKGFLNLRPMTDPAKIAATSVLASLFRVAFILGTKTKNLTAITMLRMVSISCLHGLTQQTPFALAGFCSVEASLGDYAGAKDTANLALELVESVQGAQSIAGRTRSTIYGVVAPFFGLTLEEMHPNYLRAFHACLAHGDIDYAYYATMSHLSSGFMRGTPLDEVNADYEKYLLEIDEFQIDTVRNYLVATWQIVRALLGKQSREGSWEETLNVSRLFEEVRTAPFNEILTLVDSSSQVCVKILFGTFGQDLNTDSQLMQRIGQYMEAAQLHFPRSFYQLMLGLGNFILFRQTGKRRFKKKARKSLKTLERFYNGKQAPVIEATYLFLVAENMLCDLTAKSSHDDLEALEKAYLDAAAARTRSQFLLVEVLCYERLAEVFGEVTNEQEKAQIYMKKTVDLYTKWGAVGKLEHLMGENQCKR